MTTKAPWKWRKVGNNWVLWGEHGMRPVVLDMLKGQLRVRNHERDVMVPFDPSHPDAQLIEASPELLEVLAGLLQELPPTDSPLHDKARGLLARLRPKASTTEER